MAIHYASLKNGRKISIETIEDISRIAWYDSTSVDRESFLRDSVDRKLIPSNLIFDFGSLANCPWELLPMQIQEHMILYQISYNYNA